MSGFDAVREVFSELKSLEGPIFGQSTSVTAPSGISVMARQYNERTYIFLQAIPIQSVTSSFTASGLTQGEDMQVLFEGRTLTSFEGLAACLRRVPEVAGTIAVQRAEQAVAFDHLAQRCHHRPRRFFLHQLRVVDLAGGIVEQHQQVIPALILKPTVPAAIDVHEHVRQRPPWPSLAVHAPFAPALHQPGSLRRRLHPG